MKIDCNKVQITSEYVFFLKKLQALRKFIEFKSYVLSFISAKRFITILTFGATEMATILQEEPVDLISKRPSYRHIGRQLVCFKAKYC